MKGHVLENGCENVNMKNVCNGWVLGGCDVINMKGHVMENGCENVNMKNICNGWVGVMM